jgi:hypothetical protein
MTSRELRTRRRAAERKAAKLTQQNDQACDACLPSPLPTHGPAASQPSPTPGFISRNAQNAQFSTGPRTPQGKLASSRNALKHGLSTGQIVIAGEDPVQFDALLATLRNEYQPVTATEELLVKQLAESHWLCQRALSLQNDCFVGGSVDEKRLSLFIRYYTTHQRAFHKALTQLRVVQKARFSTSTPHRPSPHGFVSPSDLSATPLFKPPIELTPEFVSQNAPPSLQTLQCTPEISQSAQAA